MNAAIDKDPNRTLTLILYVLYIVAIFTGGLLAVIALIINYVKRDSVRGSIFESHFTWQIRSFWWYLAWNIMAFVPLLLLLVVGQYEEMFVGIALGGTVFCITMLIVSWLWVVYRAIIGLVRLNDNEAMYEIS